MGKALFIMDMPENCEECKILSFEMDCPFNKLKSTPYNKKADWCPLKPMPEKKYLEGSPLDDRFDVGWNACIDKILEDSHDE